MGAIVDAGDKKQKGETMKDEIKLTGRYPEFDIDGIHYCMLDECPSDHFQVLVTVQLNVPRSRLGDLIAKLQDYEQNVKYIWNEDDECELTLTHKEDKQIKL